MCVMVKLTNPKPTHESKCHPVMFSALFFQESRFGLVCCYHSLFHGSFRYARYHFRDPALAPALCNSMEHFFRADSWMVWHIGQLIY